MLEAASAEDLFATAAADLLSVYGWRFRQSLLQVELTARGHAMASPAPGFVQPRLASLARGRWPALFAHSDLSGLSLFEEAAWWGSRRP